MGRKKIEIIEKEITEKQPKNIQQEFQKFIRKMIREYGSMEEFKKAYIKSLIEGNNIVPRRLRHIFICYIDLNQPDYICREKKEYMNLLSVIYNDSMSLVINTENFDNMWKEVMKKLTTKERNTIIKHFGLNGEIKTLQEIADEYKVSKERIRQVEENALNKLKEEKCMQLFAPYVDDVIDPNYEEEIINEFFKFNSIFVDDPNNKKSDEKMEEFKKLVKAACINHQIKNKNLKQIMELPKVKKEPIVDYAFPEKVIVPQLKYLSKRAKSRYKGKIIDTADVVDLKEEIPKDVLIAIYKQVAECEKAKRYRNKVNRISRTIKYHPDELIKNNPQLRALGINDRICKILENDNIKTLSDLLSYSIYDLRQMGTLSKHNITTIAQIVHRYGFVIEDENVDKEMVGKKISRAKAKKILIEEARFSTRTLLSLKRVGINTFADLIDYSAEEIMKIKNIGENSVKEIIYILNSYGLKLAEEPAKSQKSGLSKKILELSEDNYRIKTKPVNLEDQEIEKEAEIHTEAYSKAMNLFKSFCNAENNEEQRNKIKEEVKVLFQDLDECEKIKIRAKIYKQVKNMEKNTGKDLDNSKER